MLPGGVVLSYSNDNLDRIQWRWTQVKEVADELLRTNGLLPLIQDADWFSYCSTVYEIVHRRAFTPHEWIDGDCERWDSIFSHHLESEHDNIERKTQVSIRKRHCPGQSHVVQYTMYYSQLKPFLEAFKMLLSELKRFPETATLLRPVPPPQAKQSRPRFRSTSSFIEKESPTTAAQSGAREGSRSAGTRNETMSNAPAQAALRPEPAPKATPEPEPATQAPPEPEPAPQAQPQPEPTPQATPEPEPAPQAQSEPEPAPKTTPEPEPTPTQAYATTDPRMVEAIEAAREWIDWLDERTPALRQMNEDELRDKLRTWHRWLDYHLWLGVFEEDSPLFDAWCSFVDSSVDRDELARLGREIETRQRHARSVLSARNVERIEATTGSAYLSGVVERSDHEPVPCELPELDDRVYRIKAGEGGYRLEGRVLIPTRAIRYRYQGP